MREKGARKWWLISLIYMATIFTVSSMPGEDIPPVLLPFSDKIAHLLEYTGLGWLLGKSFRVSSFTFPGVLTVLVGILYGLSDEVHQLFVPNRQCDVVDLIFDGLGCSLAQIIFYCSRKSRREQQFSAKKFATLLFSIFPTTDYRKK